MREASSLLTRFIVSDAPGAWLGAGKQGQVGGIFEIASALARSAALPPAQQARVEGILTWFAQNLRTASLEDEPRAVCWYKPEASLYIGKTRELAALLPACGCQVTVLTARDPGHVVYEDEFQLAAITCTGWQRRVYQVRAKARTIQQRLSFWLTDALLGVLGKQDD